MPQLHVYVDKEVADLVRKQAEAKGVSVSKFLADVVAAQVAPGWPKEYFNRVVGKWKGPLERRSQGKLEKREVL